MNSTRVGLVAVALAIASIPLAASAQTTPPPASTAPVAPPGCTASEHRQFDFWVGTWDVVPTGSEKLVARSLIENLYSGCAIRENWMPLSNGYGGSLSGYDTRTSSGGAIVDFRGGWNGKAMVLEGLWPGVLGPGKDALVRMTYTKEADGSVRQLGQTSVDNGKTWQPSFDFSYRRPRVM